MANEIKADGQF